MTKRTVDKARRPARGGALRRRLSALATPLIAALIAACVPPGPGDDTTALVGGRLIDGTGAAAVEDAVVVMGGGRIIAAGVAGDVTVPAGATVIDVAGKTVMPGMIEGNSHIIFDGQSNHPGYFAGRYRSYYEIGARNLNACLMQGITTSRDTMDPLEEMIRLREDIESGLIAGSRLFTSGTILNYPGVYRMFEDPNDSLLAGATAEGIAHAKASMVLPVRDGPHGREIVADYARAGSRLHQGLELQRAGKHPARAVHRGAHGDRGGGARARPAGHDPHVVDREHRGGARCRSGRHGTPHPRGRGGGGAAG